MQRQPMQTSIRNHARQQFSTRQPDRHLIVHAAFVNHLHHAAQDISSADLALVHLLPNDNPTGLHQRPGLHPFFEPHRLHASIRNHRNDLTPGFGRQYHLGVHRARCHLADRSGQRIARTRLHSHSPHPHRIQKLKKPIQTANFPPISRLQPHTCKIERTHEPFCLLLHSRRLASTPKPRLPLPSRLSSNSPIEPASRTISLRFIGTTLSQPQPKLTFNASTTNPANSCINTLANPTSPLAAHKPEPTSPPSPKTSVAAPTSRSSIKPG